ncbi:hypothetical protein TcasGA2_TC002187 [Tribolium castaneum]|uniref:Integrase core domain-containing protein n=1 Tax=Tribolium castaneum TaxID=7070 RepID=D6WXW8_TRICA|nr:hypothetical protein TcasGA2_TC002187 [Tribolium castaneum]
MPGEGKVKHSTRIRPLVSKSELRDTKSELRDTKSELPVSKSELPDTKSELPDTKSELPVSKSELRDTKSELPSMEVDSLLKFYFRLGLRHAEILSFLVLRHGVFISESTLKRALRRQQLFRRKKYSRLQNVLVFLQEEIQKSGQLHGYRWMHLRCLQKGFIVRQETVRFILQIIDPVGVEYRRRKRLRRRQYFSKGPNFLWHVDSYDKLKPYGIAINGCIDGFSRSIMWLEAGSTSNDPRVIAGYFLKTVYRCGGCPRTVRTDMGTENYYLEQIQLFFKRLEDDEHAPPAFIYGASTANQKLNVGGLSYADIMLNFG